MKSRFLPEYSMVVVKQGVLTELPPPRPMASRLAWVGGPGEAIRQANLWRGTLHRLGSPPSLSGLLSRMVIDNTGLTGTYRADLHYTPDTPAANGQANSASSLSIFTAVQEQLGFKLVPTNGPVDCLIIDHAEMPSED